jgi:hypothetical protein
MLSVSSCFPRTHRFLAALWLVVGLAVLAPGAALADPGRFEVINATGRIEAGRWLVDARVDLALSDEALEALQSGIALRIAFQYEVIRARRFWIDETVVTAQQNFELEYLSLSKRYVVRNLETEAVNSYATLFSALRYLGQIRDYPLTGAPVDGSPGRYTFGMRAVLDWEKLPGPLAMLTFWRGDFSLESDWYRWQANS